MFIFPSLNFSCSCPGLRRCPTWNCAWRNQGSGASEETIYQPRILRHSETDSGPIQTCSSAGLGRNVSVDIELTMMNVLNRVRALHYLSRSVDKNGIGTSASLAALLTRVTSFRPSSSENPPNGGKDSGAIMKL